MQEICNKYAKICNVCEYQSSMRICKKYAKYMQEYAIYAIIYMQNMQEFYMQNMQEYALPTLLMGTP